MEQDSSSFLTISEVAARARRRPWTVRAWIRRGLLPAVRLTSRSVFVTEADWMKFVSDRHMQIAPNTPPPAGDRPAKARAAGGSERKDGQP